MACLAPVAALDGARVHAWWRVACHRKHFRLLAKLAGRADALATWAHESDTVIAGPDGNWLHAIATHELFVLDVARELLLPGAVGPHAGASAMVQSDGSAAAASAPWSLSDRLAWLVRLTATVARHAPAARYRTVAEALLAVLDVPDAESALPALAAGGITPHTIATLLVQRRPGRVTLSQVPLGPLRSIAGGLDALLLRVAVSAAAEGMQRHVAPPLHPPPLLMLTRRQRRG
jgi:hypothetical protein